MLPLIHACKSRRDSAYKEKSRVLTIKLHPENWPSLIMSSLKHHVKTINMSAESDPSAVLSDVFLLSMSSVTALKVWIDAASLARKASVTCKLHSNDLQSATRADAALMPRVPSFSAMLRHTQPDLAMHTPLSRQYLISLCSHMHRVSYLCLFLPGSDAALNVAPLQRMASLTDLNLFGIEVTNGIIDAIRAMIKLRRLTINWGIWSATHLLCLAAPPQALPSSVFVSVERTKLGVAHLQALQLLYPLLALASAEQKLLLEAVPLLPQLPALRSLNLALADVPGIAPAGLFLVPLCGCKGLTRVVLTSMSFDLKELETMAASLPQLAALAFVECSLPDLSALAKSTSIRRLGLRKCPELKATHLLKLASLSSLRVLSLKLPQTEVEIANILLSPPSKLPQLLSFEITAE
jgi:hypothetical protein